jgi:hypothetical protein
LQQRIVVLPAIGHAAPPLGKRKSRSSREIRHGWIGHDRAIGPCRPAFVTTSV